MEGLHSKWQQIPMCFLHEANATLSTTKMDRHAVSKVGQRLEESNMQQARLVALGGILHGRAG
eukprot:6513080-Alexandrium_andersonii.AAC.1